MKGRSFPKTFERMVEFLLSGDMLKEALETGNSPHKGPCRGTWRGFSFSGTSERQMKEASGNGAPLFNLKWAPF
jgi:hypothetical protein